MIITKARLLKPLVVALAVGSTVVGTQTIGRAQCCLNFPPFSGVTVHTFAGCTSQNQPFTVTVDSAAGLPIPAGTYAFWCIDDVNVDITVPHTYSGATLYSSCDPDLTMEPGLRQPTLGSYANIAQINYILNNPDHIAATYVDIQNAIWTFAGGPPGVDFSQQYGSCYDYSIGYPNGPGYLALVAGAVAHPDYVVPCGGVVGVIISIPNQGGVPVQNIVIPVPCSCSAPGCTRTIGYYKTHPNAITPLPIYLGPQGGPKTFVVSTSQIGVKVLKQNVYGTPSNGITKLYAQLLAAKINVLGGANVTDILGVISDADAFLATHDWQDWTSLSATEKGDVLLWQSMLDAYNNGVIGPGHCD